MFQKDATARNKELLIMIGWGNNTNTVNRQTKQDGTGTGTGCVMKPADKIRRQQWAVGITGTAISNMTCAVRDRGPLQSNTSAYLGHMMTIPLRHASIHCNKEEKKTKRTHLLFPSNINSTFYIYNNKNIYIPKTVRFQYRGFHFLIVL